MYAWMDSMASLSGFTLQSEQEPIEAWPWLESDLLITTRSHQVCMTCQSFRHRAAGDGIPLLTCQRHRGLIAHGEHLTRRCSSWSHDLVLERGWAPEVS